VARRNRILAQLWHPSRELGDPAADSESNRSARDSDTTERLPSHVPLFKKIRVSRGGLGRSSETPGIKLELVTPSRPAPAGRGRPGSRRAGPRPRPAGAHPAYAGGPPRRSGRTRASRQSASCSFQSLPCERENPHKTVNRCYTLQQVYSFVVEGFHTAITRLFRC
jgi:hypothetical protein